MKRNLRLHLSPLQEKLFVRITVVLLVVALAWIIFSPRSGALAYLQQRSKLHNLRERTVKLEQSNEELEKETEKLRNDPGYLEEVARREHGLLKKNEYIYDFSQQRGKESK
ncbi:MAG: septum formation initiator family protein [Desulfoprunum sp.]|jgi:cell division protein FtsB|uniref:FtsB family cell division protein n=1 Tax=Desulfoprunum sp. TaxID=2020866 RepID=UPI0026AAFAF7